MRGLGRTTFDVSYVRIPVEGWRCVRCMDGRYIGGRCSSCGFVVTRFARLPRLLVKPVLRGAA